MEVFFEFIYTDPLSAVGTLFAFLAALAFLLLISGFFTGFKYVLSMDGHDGHMAHYRFYAMWGTLLLFGLFTAWQVVRLVFSFFTGEPGPSGATLTTLAVVWALYLGFYWFSLRHIKTGH
jgi:hypothetical protein